MDLIVHCEPFYTSFIEDEEYPHAFKICAWCGEKIKYEDGRVGHMFCSSEKSECATKYWNYHDEYFRIDDNDSVFQKKLNIETNQWEWVFIYKIQKKEEKYDPINFYIPNRRQTPEEVFL